MIDSFPIFSILEYGLPGFAVVLLWLGFRLQTQLQDRLIKVDIELFDNNEAMFAKWVQMARTQVVNSRIFMGLSAAFFAGGLLIAWFSPENRIIVSVVPSEGTRPMVTLQEAPVELNAVGAAKLFVRNENIVRVNNASLFKLISSHERERDDLKKKLHNLTASQPSSAEVGF